MIGLLLLRCYFNLVTMCMGCVVALLHVAVDGQPANKRNCKHPHDKNVRRVETNKYICVLHGLTCLPIVDYFTKNFILHNMVRYTESVQKHCCVLA